MTVFLSARSRANRRRMIVLAKVLLLVAFPGFAWAGSTVESNVVYGMYSGLALLMDVYHPEKPNGYGVIYIAGSGWHARLSYHAQPLKESNQVKTYAEPLAKAGYTVFAVNHRAAPRYRYPSAVEDVQRAVRFIRHHAKRFGIDPQRIGGTGGSSGGYLIAMLGVLDGKGDQDDADPVNRESARLHCVVARAAPVDLFLMRGEFPSVSAASFLGMVLQPRAEKSSQEYRTYWEASPINHVSADDPPFLLLHGDADQTVRFEQSEWMEAALRDAGVPVKLLRIPGGGHGATFPGAKNPPDYIGETLRWFDRYLRDQQ
jgi:acetyl esterase/lipase